MTDTPWRGIFPSLPTPFLPDGGVDVDAQRRIVRFAIDRGAHGLICFGLAGEVARLVPDERLRLCHAIVEETDGEVPVLLGVGAESEHVAVELARSAEAAGVDGVVIPPPVLGKLDEASLLRYFTRVADAVSVPAMIQDAPDLLGVEVGANLVGRVAGASENVRYVKLEVGADGLATWIDELEGRVAVFGGNGGLYVLDCLRAGAHGIAPGVELTDLLVAIHDAEVGGDTPTAERLFARFLPMMVFELQDIDHYNACAKYVLSRRGVDLPIGLCPPAKALPPEAYPILDRYLADLESDVLPVSAAGK